LAGPAHVLDRAELPPAAVFDHRMTTARVQLGMPTPVTVRADEIALLCLIEETFTRAIPLPHFELLR